jgi:hypothetical protein
MKLRTASVSLVAFFAGLSVCFAADIHMGTWKLNEAKSKFGAGVAKNNTAIYEAVGDNIKITVEGIDNNGKPVHQEWTGRFDGKDYPVIGDPTSDRRSYKKVDERTLEFTGKKAGKVTVTGRIVVTAGGNTRTVTAMATDAKGTKVMSTAVYDKQ